jgi:hypothetical protein
LQHAAAGIPFLRPHFVLNSNNLNRLKIAWLYPGHFPDMEVQCPGNSSQQLSEIGGLKSVKINRFLKNAGKK